MSGDVKLDAATLRHVGRRLRESLDSVRDVLGSDSAAFVRCIEGMATEADDLARSIESAPPTLSSWVAACEGTALGEPDDIEARWSQPDGSIVTVQRGDDADTFQVRIDWFDPDAAGHHDDGCRYRVEACSTPAELRAALESLAKAGA